MKKRCGGFQKGPFFENGLDLDNGGLSDLMIDGF